MTPSIAVVFGLVLLAGILFATDRVPNEIVALAVAVLLAALGRWTTVTPQEAISGFASPATITVLAMFILSEGVRATGVMEKLGRRLARATRTSPARRLGATLLMGGLPAGFVNNTPLVSVLIPAITAMSRRARSSPSRLLIPLSFVSMMGGMLTVIGTSTSLLASDLSGRLLGHPIGLFEFTALGAFVLLVGGSYLMLVGWRLVPERVRPEEDLTEKFRMRDYLGRASIPEDSPLVGLRLHDLEPGEEYDLDVLQIVRDGETFQAPGTDQAMRAGDTLVLRAGPRDLEAFCRENRLEPRRLQKVTDRSFVDPGHTLLEVTLAPESELDGQTLVSAQFRDRYTGTVLGLQRGDTVIRDRIETAELREGDSLLVLVTREKAPVLEAEPGLAVTQVTPADPAEAARPGTPGATIGGGARTPRSWEARPRRGERPPALPIAILAAVVVSAAAGVWPIYIAALAGVVALVLTGSLTTARAYRSVSWDIVFLLAGILPLGLAMERTGAAGYLADLVLAATAGLSPIVILGIFYLLTAALTNVISNNAAVVLMIPVALDAAARVGGEPFSFLLAVTFGASTAFMTPIGYQTNLLVYTPGGYRFRDYVVAGAPLQLLLAVATTVGIAALWGV